MFDTTVIGSTVAVDCVLGDGGQSTYLLEKLRVDGNAVGIRIQRPNGANRPMTIEATHVSITAADCFAYDGTPSSSSQLQLRMFDLTANTPGGQALQLGPLGGRLSGELFDCKMSGDVTVATGGGATEIAIANVRSANGNVTLGTSSLSPLQIDQSRFDGCAISTIGSSTVVFTDTCFVGGSLQGSAAAPIQTTACHLAVTPVGHVTQTGSLPAEQLGSMSVLPLAPVLGGSFTLQPDLPAGLVGFFVLGESAAMVTEPLPGVRAYLNPMQSVVVVAFAQQQQATTFPVPNNLALLGSDWICQMAVAPAAGTQAPALQVPPGQRFVLH